MSERIMLSGLIAAPPIVRVSSLMPISIITHRIAVRPSMELLYLEARDALASASESLAANDLLRATRHVQQFLVAERKIVQAMEATNAAT